MIYFLFVIFIVIASLLMIGIVLIQESKGGGLASNFSSSNAIMGVRKTTDFIEKEHGVSPLQWYSSASYALMLLRFLLPKAALWRRQLLKHRTQTRTQLLVSVQASSRLRLLVLSRLRQLTHSRHLPSPQNNTNKTV